MKKFRSGFMLFTGILVAFTSCKRQDPSWETGLVIPLAHASMSIDNLLADSLSQTNSDGSVKLVYSTDFLGLNTDTIFNIPDTTVVSEYNIPFGSLNVNPGQVITPTTPSETTFGANNAQLTIGILSSGHMDVLLKNDITRRVILRYQIPCATLNGIPFDTSFLMSAAPDATHSSYRYVTLDLSGYTIDFTGVNHNRVNVITSTFTAQIDPTETSPAQVTPDDSVAAYVTYSGIRPWYLRGYFGNQTIHIGPEETFFSIFHNVRSGSLGLDSLKMSLHLDNYVGMDARVTINSIWSRNSHTGNSVYLNHPIIGTPININRGTLTYSNPPVTPDPHLYVFDNSNSNAKALVENLPDELGYDVTLITDPLGNVSQNNDFLYSDYGINAKLDVEMPLNFFADQLVIADTVAMDLSSIHNKENIERGKLTLYAQNSFPFASTVQMFLVDANGNAIDSIVAPTGQIASGITTMSSGYLVSAGFTSSRLEIPLSDSQTQELLNSTRIIIRATFDTNSDPVYAKIFNSNRLDMQLSANFDYLVN